MAQNVTKTEEIPDRLGDILNHNPICWVELVTKFVVKKKNSIFIREREVWHCDPYQKMCLYICVMLEQRGALAVTF